MCPAPLCHHNPSPLRSAPAFLPTSNNVKNSFLFFYFFSLTFFLASVFALSFVPLPGRLVSYDFSCSEYGVRGVRRIGTQTFKRLKMKTPKILHVFFWSSSSEILDCIKIIVSHVRDGFSPNALFRLVRRQEHVESACKVFFFFLNFALFLFLSRKMSACSFFGVAFFIHTEYIWSHFIFKVFLSLSHLRISCSNMQPHLFVFIHMSSLYINSTSSSRHRPGRSGFCARFFRGQFSVVCMDLKKRTKSFQDS